MNNDQVAHLWANKSRQQAKGSNVFFEGNTIYSYGHHFPMARLYKGVVLYTTGSYSVTTAKHLSIVRRACSHLTVFNVDDVSAEPSKFDIASYRGFVGTTGWTCRDERDWCKDLYERSSKVLEELKKAGAN